MVFVMRSENLPPAVDLPQRQPHSRQRILVVENDVELSRRNVEALTYAGYRAEAAADGAAGWEALRRNRYDLLVTAQNLPKLAGVELLKRLHAARIELPVILVAGRMPMEKLKRHPWLQIDARLLKPYAVEELLEAVKMVLSAAGRDHEETVAA
jgi:two-component system OmpR family response regulator